MLKQLVQIIRPAIFAAIVVSLVSAPNALAQSDDGIQKNRDKAFRLVAEQNFTAALPILEKLSIDLPDDARVFFYLGFSLVAKANNTTDESEKKVLKERSRKAFIRSKELNIQEPVVDALIQSLSGDNSDPGFSSNKEADRLVREGEASYSKGKLDDALKSYEKALKADPAVYEAALFSGDVYVVQGKYAKAEEFYQRAITINPYRETAYRYSATPLMKQQKYDQARDRYIEAYITEPYNRFATGGLTQWSEVTGTPVGHPEIVFPKNIQVGSDGNVVVDVGPESKLGGRQDGTFFWTLYGTTRTKWRKEGFTKAYPNEKEYRHSLAEEVEALRSVTGAVKAEKGVTKLDPSLATLMKLDEQGLLESYILLARPTDGIVADYPSYLKGNREKLRRYVADHVIGPKRSAETRKPANDDDSKSRSSRRLVDRTYDAAADKTTVRIPLLPVTCVRDGCIFLSFETSFAGRKSPGKVERTVFGLIVFTKSLRPQENAVLEISIDGKTIEISNIEFIGEESKDGLRGLIYGTGLTETEIGALAAGKKVEMKLGTLQFGVPEATIGAIAEFYATAKSPE